MRLTRFTPYAIGAALALTLGSSLAVAQQPRSQQRIPVTKESRGEVQPTPAPAPVVNQDSINAAERARQDSIAAAARERARLDSIAAVERARQDSIAAAERARQDSIARAEAEAARIAWLNRPIGGFYWGLAAGMATPTSGLDVAHDRSFTADMPFGWDPSGSPLGLRFDIGYSTFQNRTSYFTAGTPSRPQVWSGSADLKLRLPALQRYTHRVGVYGVGGGTYFRYNNLTVVNNGGTTAGTSTWSNKFGWNAGGGLSMGWGRSNVFAEARYMSMSVDGRKATHVPIVLGLSWF